MFLVPTTWSLTPGGDLLPRLEHWPMHSNNHRTIILTLMLTLALLIPTLMHGLGSLCTHARATKVNPSTEMNRKHGLWTLPSGLSGRQ